LLRVVSLTETTPITPYPPSSAAFSILTALLSFIDFGILNDLVTNLENFEGKKERK
jgi:hypothetical protein